MSEWGELADLRESENSNEGIVTRMDSDCDSDARDGRQRRHPGNLLSDDLASLTVTVILSEPFQQATLHYT